MHDSRTSETLATTSLSCPPLSLTHALLSALHSGKLAGTPPADGLLPPPHQVEESGRSEAQTRSQLPLQVTPASWLSRHYVYCHSCRSQSARCSALLLLYTPETLRGHPAMTLLHGRPHVATCASSDSLASSCGIGRRCSLHGVQVFALAIGHVSHGRLIAFPRSTHLHWQRQEACCSRV